MAPAAFSRSRCISASSSIESLPTRALTTRRGLISARATRIPRITESPVSQIVWLGSVSTSAEPLTSGFTSRDSLNSRAFRSLEITAVAESAVRDKVTIVIDEMTAIFCRLRTAAVRYFIPLNQYSTAPLRIGSSTNLSEISARASTTRMRKAISAQSSPSISTRGRVI